MSDGGSKPVGFVFIRDNSRRYNVWEGDIDGKHINIRGYGALFPEGYLPGRTPETSLLVWHCPVRTCGQSFVTPPYLGDHFLKSHAGAILHDNMDGSFSVLPRDSDSANDANLQPYVVSQGGMPSPSPSLLHPSHSMPPNPESGAIDTSAMPVNDDKPKPLTGNKSPTGKSGVTNADENHRSSDKYIDGHDPSERGRGEHGLLPQPPNPNLPLRKRDANNHNAAPEPKKAKTATGFWNQLLVTGGKHVLEEYRISDMRQKPAAWEELWGQLPYSRPTAYLPQPALAYSASSVAQGCVVTDDGTSIWIPPSPLSVAQGCVITDDGTSILITNIKHDQTYIVECDVNLPLPDLFCTIHNAPVNVTITGEEPFTIFPGGCWRVRNEHVCKVANCYPDSEATIHVISPSVRNKED